MLSVAVFEDETGKINVYDKNRDWKLEKKRKYRNKNNLYLNLHPKDGGLEMEFTGELMPQGALTSFTHVTHITTLQARHC